MSTTTNDINNEELTTIPPRCTNDSNQQAIRPMNGDIDFEIVGLFSNSNGRFCCCHRVCGAHVVEGDVLRLVMTLVSIGEGVEAAVKLVKIMDGMDGCTVGFIPRVQSRLPKVLQNINKFCIVHELYQSSPSTYKRKKGEKNHGMASAILLSTIPLNE
jgi:hypothetical protein